MPAVDATMADLPGCLSEVHITAHREVLEDRLPGRRGQDHTREVEEALAGNEHLCAARVTAAATVHATMA